MATTRLMPLHTGKGRTVGQAISDIIDYTENPQKTDGGRLITSWQCDSRIADAEFLFAKNQYTQKTGRVRGEDDVIAYHLRQSFVPGEITPEDANRLGCELAKRFTKGNHAYIVCTHIDKAHIHNHVIWNSTALSQTRKFRNFWGSSRAVRRLNDTICIENGYSIVENPKRHGKSYNKWLGDKKKPSHRERICAAIDDALTQKPDSFETLLELLRQAGYFDGLGLKKLPTIKALNAEYAELLAEKKAAYADYRKAREEMKELLTAKANIDRILELDKEQEEANERREKEAEQR